MVQYDVRSVDGLVDQLGNKGARLVILTAASLKRGSEITPRPFPFDTARIRSVVSEWGLNSVVVPGRNYLPVPEWKKSFEEKNMQSAGLKYTIMENGIDAQYTFVVEDSVNRILIWKGNRRVEPHVVMESSHSFGRFLGFPECCLGKDHFRTAKREYGYQVANRFREKGLNGIEHLVGISHTPCHIDCEETKDLRYCTYLKLVAPQIYQEGVKDLLNGLERSMPSVPATQFAQM